MTSLTVKLSDLIAPPFYEVHKAVKQGRYTHFMLGGGRGSTKSSFVSLEIILGIMSDPDANAVALRKVGLYLKDSVYEQLLWAISALGVDAYWQPKLSPLELIYIPTGQRIIFRGADKPKKLKSTKVSKGYIRYIWYEELDEFAGNEEIRTINQSLMRGCFAPWASASVPTLGGANLPHPCGGNAFTVFYTYNPPKSQRNWVNTEALISRADRLNHHSTYLDVPREWLGEQWLLEAEYLKKTDPDAYAHEYLGEVTGTGAEVFKNLSIRPITDAETAGFEHIYRGLDWGYGADPFAYEVMNYDRKRKRLYIYYEFYKCGAMFDTIAREIKRENTRNGIITAESAEPRSNDELRARGLRVIAAKKGAGSVEHGIAWLQNLEQIVIDPARCPNAAREFSEYELEPDGRGGYRDGFPDRDNHSIDAVRYAMESETGHTTVKSTVSKKRLGIY